jgi:hypothetical protein
LAIVRFSFGWLVVGGFAVIGAVAAMVRVFKLCAWTGLPAEAAALVIGSAAVGAIMVRHAPLVPRREPAIAGCAGIALLGLWHVTMAPGFHTWVAGLGDRELPILATYACASAAASYAGGTLAGRWSASTPLWPATSVLSAVCGLAIIALTGQLVASWFTQSDVWITLATLASMYVSCALVQCVVPIRRVWSCGAGISLFILMLSFAEGRMHDPISSVIGWILCMLIGVGGAQTGWQLRGKPVTAVPPARAR